MLMMITTISSSMIVKPPRVGCVAGWLEGRSLYITNSRGRSALGADARGGQGTGLCYERAESCCPAQILAVARSARCQRASTASAISGTHARLRALRGWLRPEAALGCSRCLRRSFAATAADCITLWCRSLQACCVVRRFGNRFRFLFTLFHSNARAVPRGGDLGGLSWCESSTPVWLRSATAAARSAA